MEKQPSFWIVSGIFIYCAGNFFLFSMFNSLSRNNLVFAFYAWNINDFLILSYEYRFRKGNTMQPKNINIPWVLIRAKKQEGNNSCVTPASLIPIQQNFYFLNFMQHYTKRIKDIQQTSCTCKRRTTQKRATFPK